MIEIGYISQGDTRTYYSSEYNKDISNVVQGYDFYETRFKMFNSVTTEDYICTLPGKALKTNPYELYIQASNNIDAYTFTITETFNNSDSSAVTTTVTRLDYSVSDSNPGNPRAITVRLTDSPSGGYLCTSIDEDLFNTTFTGTQVSYYDTFLYGANYTSKNGMDVSGIVASYWNKPSATAYTAFSMQGTCSTFYCFNRNNSTDTFSFKINLYSTTNTVGNTSMGNIPSLQTYTSATTLDSNGIPHVGLYYATSNSVNNVLLATTVSRFNYVTSENEFYLATYEQSDYQGDDTNFIYLDTFPKNSYISSESVTLTANNYNAVYRDNNKLYVNTVANTTLTAIKYATDTDGNGFYGKLHILRYKSFSSWIPVNSEVSEFLDRKAEVFSSNLYSYNSTSINTMYTVSNDKAYLYRSPLTFTRSTVLSRNYESKTSNNSRGYIDTSYLYWTSTETYVKVVYTGYSQFDVTATTNNAATGSFSALYTTGTVSTTTVAGRTSKTESIPVATLSESGSTATGSIVSLGTSVTARVNSNLSYFTDVAVVASSTFSNFRTSTVSIQASSTSSNFQVAETVLDRENYTYLTTFYGSLIGNYINATSWINSAIMLTTTQNYWPDGADNNVVASVTSKTFGYPGAVTTLSLRSYDAVTSQRLTSASISREISASKTMVSTSSYKDSISNNYSSTTYASITSTIFYSFTNPNITVGYEYYGTYTGTFTASKSGSYINQNGSSSYSEYNTSDYGTTARISDLIKSSSYANLYDTYGVQNYYYEYDVDSIWKYEDQITSTLKDYTTALATSFTFSYVTNETYRNYAYTKTSSLAFNSTADRFIYRVGRTSTFSFRNYATETVAIYNGSTMGTLRKSETMFTDTYTETSTLAETFISSTADFDYGYETTASETKSSYSGRFINSYSVVNATTSEQQNDTLVFVSSNMTVSNYQGTYTTTTFNSVQVKGTATIYTDYYTDSTISHEEVQQVTSTEFTQYESTTSAAVTITQSIKYTPIYSTVDGVYVTA